MAEEIGAGDLDGDYAQDHIFGERLRAAELGYLVDLLL